MRMRYPSTMKAPGARTKTKAPYCSGKIVTLNIFPVPKNSRTAPKRVSAQLNPKPIPTPSSIESNALCFAANDSARPNTMQFTTIRGINNPRLAYSAGT